MLIAESEKGHRHIFGETREGIALYLVDFLRTFAISLPGIFAPLFILKFPDKPILLPVSTLISDLLWVVFYYVVFSFTTSLLNLFATNLIFKQLGFKR